MRGGAEQARTSGRLGSVQRRQVYGVVVDTLTSPDRSRIGREYSVESLLMSGLPIPSADPARADVNAR
jgi:hypothetical protein